MEMVSFLYGGACVMHFEESFILSMQCNGALLEQRLSCKALVVFGITTSYDERPPGHFSKLRVAVDEDIVSENSVRM